MQKESGSVFTDFNLPFLQAHMYSWPAVKNIKLSKIIPQRIWSLSKKSSQQGLQDYL